MKSDQCILHAPKLLTSLCSVCEMTIEVAETERTPCRKKKRQEIKQQRLLVRTAFSHTNVFFKDGTKTADSEDPTTRHFVLSDVVLSRVKMMTGGTGEIHTALWMLPPLQMFCLT